MTRKASKKHPQVDPPGQSPSPQGTGGARALLVLGALTAGLALFQWAELWVVSSGGKSVCQINQVFNCEAVWGSEIARNVHHLFGVPIAGLGLLWALTVLASAWMLIRRLRQGLVAREWAVALKLSAAVGVASSIFWAYSSFRIGAVCLTCLGTYALTLAVAIAAFRFLPGPWVPASSEWQPALLKAGGFAAVAYVLLLGPGILTPAVNPKPAFAAAKGSVDALSAGDVEKALATYLSNLDGAEKQGLSDALEAFRQSPAKATAQFAVRNRAGDPAAPMRIVEFTDIRCPHCRILEETLKQLRAALPAKALSVEARQFPLDGACNPAVPPNPKETGVRCLAAKVQICLESTPNFAAVRERLFAEQETLTVPRVMELAQTGGASREALESCVQSPETTAKLLEDVRYAMLYSPEGTPIVIVNGKQAPPAGAFLFALAMAGGNPDSLAFKALPPPALAGR